MKRKRMLIGGINKIQSMKKAMGLLLIPAMLFVSCNDDPEPVMVNVSFPDAVNNPNVKTIELADTTFKFGITADQNAEGNVDAAIEADLSLVSSFNTSHQTEYLSMVEGSYEFSGTSLTIADGGLKSDSLVLTIKPEGKLEREKSYLLPVKIKTITGNGTVDEQYGVNYFVFTVNKAKEVVLADISRSNWEIQCSSEETKGEGSGQGKAIYLLDNNIFTFWHSQYLPTATEYPHWLLVNMKQERSIRAFWIVSCQESWATSKPKDMYFEVSSDNKTWTRVAEVTGTSSLDRQVFQLDKNVTATYFKVTFVNSLSSEIYCYLGEIGASYDSAE